MLGAGFSVYRASDFDRQPAFAAAFDALCDADWRAAGVWRWRAFLTADGPHPMVVIAQRDEAGSLLGVIVGVWQPEPVSRFDDLFDRPTELSPRWLDELGWPIGGYWHFIALTVAPAARGSGAQQALVGAALDWVLVPTTDVARSLTHFYGLGAETIDQLIAEAERQVLQERRVGMCAQPGLDSAIDLLAKVYAGSLPARKERFRHLVRLDAKADVYEGEIP
jgi:GNAT superfamily N-acetyltransferase